MAKIKLKTVQELMGEGFVFEESGELTGDTQVVEPHMIHHLGKIIEAQFNGNYRSYINCDKFAFHESLVKEVIQEEDLFDKKRYDFHKDFNFYLQESGSLYIVLKGSKMDKHYILNEKIYKCITDKLF